MILLILLNIIRIFNFNFWHVTFFVELSTAIEARQRLDSQQQENEVVSKV